MRGLSSSGISSRVLLVHILGHSLTLWHALFIAVDGSTGYELWKSSGTAESTVLVKDICPGSNGSGALYLVNVGGTLYFQAYNDGTGNELWKSDGTSSGTVLVKDIHPGGSSVSRVIS